MTPPILDPDAVLKLIEEMFPRLTPSERRAMAIAPPDDIADAILDAGAERAVRVVCEVVARLPAQVALEVSRATLRPRVDDVPRGLSLAADLVAARLLGLDLTEVNAAKPDRLAAVARGVHLRSESQDAAPQIRELSVLVRSAVEMSKKSGIEAGSMVGAYLEHEDIVPAERVAAADLSTVLAAAQVSAAEARSPTGDPIPALVGKVVAAVGIVRGSPRRIRDIVRRSLERP